MKVAVILEAVFPENKGGLERWFFHLSNEIAKNVESVCYLNSAGINRENGNLRYKCLTKYQWSYKENGIRSIKQAIQFTISLIKWLLKNHYDLIYLSSVPILSIFLIPIVRISNRKTVIVVEWLEYWPLRYWRLYKGRYTGTLGWVLQLFALQLGNFKTTFTFRTRDKIQSRSLPWIKNRTILLPGLVDSNLVIKSSGNEVRNDIVFVGRLVQEKQPLLAIRIIENYLELGWNGTFWLIGSGPEEEKIKHLLAKSKARDNTKLLINASDELVEEKFKTSFLLLHPSKREGYGLVCVEAAFKGLPTLLINYPNNGAVDLGINPNLVSNSDGITDIVNLIEYAKVNFLYESKRASTWAKESLDQKTIKKSIVDIMKLVN